MPPVVNDLENPRKRRAGLCEPIWFHKGRTEPANLQDNPHIP